MVPSSSLPTVSIVATGDCKSSKQAKYCVLPNDALKKGTAFTCLDLEDSLRNNVLFLRTLLRNFSIIRHLHTLSVSWEEMKIENTSQYDPNGAGQSQDQAEPLLIIRKASKQLSCIVSLP